MYTMRALCCVVFVLCATGAMTFADPIRFDNPDTSDRFEWDAPEPAVRIVLNLMAPYDAQPGTPSTDGHIQQSWGFVGHERTGYLEFGLVNIQNAITSDGSFVLPVAEGFIIGPDYDWFGGGSVTIYEEIDDEVITFIPEGVPQYFGVTWAYGTSGDSGYGWFGAVRTRQALDVFAWGYETEPNVGVAAGAIPEPASLLGLLLCGAFAARRR